MLPMPSAPPGYPEYPTLIHALAGAAELVKGNTSRVPIAVIRGFPWERDDTATIAPVLRDQSRDLFR